MQNFFVVMITPTLITQIQWKAYLIFMCTNFAFVPLVYFCYPETMNLTLEEIDYLYTTPGKSARQVSKDLRRLHKERVVGFGAELGLAPTQSVNGAQSVEIVEHDEGKEKS